MVFNILVSNTDDHLRNHGFLREGGGWRLAPAYDLNPTSTLVRSRHHALGTSEDDSGTSMEGAFDVAPRFGLDAARSRTLARAVARAVRPWREVALRFGVKRRDLDWMASAFEHDDSKRAGP